MLGRGVHPINVLGCAEQYQIRNPSLPISEGYSLLVGIKSMADTVGDLQLNDAQAAAAEIFIYASSSTGISQVLSNKGTSLLLAQLQIRPSTRAATQ